MARRKRTASHYSKAVTRLAALKSIDVKMDLGNGMTVAGYEAAINLLRDRLNDYNLLLSTLDEKANLANAAELELRDLSERMLAGVASKYGKNSNEYEMAGGKRKSERRKPKATEAVTV